ncbi:MAG TPA: MlaD family protein [Candidatus Binataceae bacterium]|nr:MlaD family protein [Candidatus Binataceae bacterium]
MARRASPVRVGAFVVLSLCLVVATVVLFGSGRLFRRKLIFVSFFRGNLNGLKVGAPVKFAGVQIGTVKRIRLRLPPSEGMLRPDLAKQVLLPVLCEIDETAFSRGGGADEPLDRQGLERMVQEGLRAELTTESLLTGLLYIEINMHPQTRIDLVMVAGTGRYPEVPTVPSKLQAVQEQALKALAKLDQIDLSAMVHSMTDTANSVTNLADSPSVKRAIDSLSAAAGSLERVSASINKLANDIDTKIDPVMANLKNTSTDADLTLRQARDTLAQIQQTFAPETPLNYELTKALEDVSSASAAIRQLADYLQRNPSALVRGKYVSDGKQ